MPLSIIQTPEERLTSEPVLSALKQGVEGRGSAILLVPSFAQALVAQQALACERGLALAVTTSTPAAWVQERWEVWGDGRAIAGMGELVIMARQAVESCPAAEREPIEVSPGIAKVLAQLVAQSLPWLPLDAEGKAEINRCDKAGLTKAETRLMELAGRLGRMLAERGFISASQAMQVVPQILAETHAVVPAVVAAGFRSLGRAERELLTALANLTEVTVVGHVEDGLAFSQTKAMLAGLGGAVRQTGRSPSSLVVRDERLSALRAVLFGDAVVDVGPEGPLEHLLAAGPVAEAELVARRVVDLASGDPMRPPLRDIVVAVPDVIRAERELVPKLVERGLSVRIKTSKPLLECPAAQAYFSFARSVARMSELACTWPAPVQGADGLMAQLGDMSWWPPRELSDFLLSDTAHVAAPSAWQADARWRGNRLLTPERLLAQLQSERETSAAVAHATQELLKGRLGSAASKLLLPYVESLAEAGAEGELGNEDEFRSVLQQVLALAGTLHELGITADPAAKGAVSLSELVELCAWAAEDAAVVSRKRYQGADGAPEVRVMSLAEASCLEPGSTDMLVACGLTVHEQPLRAADDLQTVLLDLLGIEPLPDPMAQARAAFHGLVSVPRWRLVTERALHDADARETYPSVMLAELLAATGASPQSVPQDIPGAKFLRVETLLGENLSHTGAWPAAHRVSGPAPAGRLTNASRGLVFVPQDGSDVLPGGKPVLSASQIETYLDCPYKWFSLRRLRLGQVDAGHTAMEMGTFAHRVMEVTHRELLLRALETASPGVPREELLAKVEADPACHLPASRVSASNVESVKALLDEEFELHRQHMYMVRRPRPNQQLLIAHDSADRAHEERLKLDLLSTVDYETTILEGFEPRFFEWGFGRHGDLVEYAGAYFTGTIDRIDVSPHGTAVIIDYKHKSPAGFNAEYDALQEGVLEGERLPNRVQSLIYAQVVRRAFEGRLRLVGTVYLSTKGNHALAGAADANVADMVFGKLSSRRAPLVSVPRQADGTSGMEGLLDQTEELVARAVRQMMAGEVEARPRDMRSCDYCPVMQCERRVAR